MPAETSSSRHANGDFRCDKCEVSFGSLENLRLHHDGTSLCSENGLTPHKRRPRKGPTGIGKKSGGKGRAAKKCTSDNIKRTPETAAVTFEGDDANMSRPVSVSRNDDILMADCEVDTQESLNCAIDVIAVKVEANSVSSYDMFRTSAVGGIYEHNNSLSSNASISLPIAIKSEASLYDSNSQPALGAATSGVDAWKCNQCKVSFESGPQLLEHLDEIRRGEHKVNIF